jgi:hypothetical protein
MQVASKDTAYSTYNSYRKVLRRNWQPQLGDREFESVLYSELVEIASAQGWKTKKTYNNCLSPLRCAFDFGYKDLRGRANPAEGLECFRLTKKDRPKIDPFSIHEAETLIRGIHTELRPSATSMSSASSPDSDSPKRSGFAPASARSRFARPWCSVRTRTAPRPTRIERSSFVLAP